MNKTKLLIVPMVLVSLFASCSEKRYTITFNCPNCKVFDESGNEVTSIAISTLQSYTPYRKFIIKNNDDCLLPLSCDVSIKNGEQLINNYNYNALTGEMYLPIVSDLTVNAPGLSKNTALEDCSWKEINDLSLTKQARTVFKVGDIKKVQLKHQSGDIYQTVRIIGFDHDELSSGNHQYSGITFEFADIISDANGYSLATPWDWRNDEESRNYDYPNSNVRKALDGGGDGSAEIRWYCKGEEEASTDPNYTKPVFEMLPDDLRADGIIKEVKKPVVIYDENVGSYIIDNDIYKTKLFLPSNYEIDRTPDKYSLNEGTTYEYYKNPDHLNIKWQIKHHDGAIENYNDLPNIKDVTWESKNYAGWNQTIWEPYPEVEAGGYYYTRSPEVNEWQSNKVNAVVDWTTGSSRISSCVLSEAAHGVAPAFCV